MIFGLFSVGREQHSCNQRVWFAVPAIILMLIWILSGFFVRQYVENVISPKEYSGLCTLSKKTLFLRKVGWGALLVSTVIWSIGVVNPLSDRLYIGGMILCLLCLIFGFRNIVRGTRLDDKQ